VWLPTHLSYHIYIHLWQAEGDAASGAWSSTQSSRTLEATTVTKRDLTPLGLYRFRVRGLRGTSASGVGGEPGPFSAPSSLVRCGALSGAEQAAAVAAGGAVGAAAAAGAAGGGEGKSVVRQGVSIDQAQL
jgi:hypothetical protein